MIVDKKTEHIVAFMGLMKVTISFVKYMPQVYLNWKRKSTEGWSLENVLLDFTGGSLSFLQIFLDWLNNGSTGAFTNGLNVAKFLLGVISMVFDAIFMFQHYVLYNPKKRAYELKEEGEEEEEVDRDSKDLL